MNRYVKKSLCVCAASLLLGGVVASSMTNGSVAARRRPRVARTRRNVRTRRGSKTSKVSYRTYQYNLKKYNQGQRSLKILKRHLNYYKKLLSHKHKRRLTRKYTQKERYWQRQINQLNKTDKKYQTIINQYKSNKKQNVINNKTFNKPKNKKRNIQKQRNKRQMTRKFKRNAKKLRTRKGRKTNNRKYRHATNEMAPRIVKPKVHKLAVHHQHANHVNQGLADATHKYVLSTNDMVSDRSLNSIQNGGGYSYGGGMLGDLVHIVNQKQVGGQTFDYIEDPSGYDNDMWIYDGELSDNPSDTPQNINLSNLENTIHSDYVNSNAQDFLSQMRSESLSFINKAREDNGVSPVSEDPTMDQLANLRANQLVKRYSHFTPDGRKYVEVDMPQFNIANKGWGENIAWNQITPRGYEKTDPTIYDEMDGNGMAYAANNNMLNHDAHSNWGHRRNMLNPNSDLIGIGSAYDPNTQHFFLAEDFYNNPTIVPLYSNNNSQPNNTPNNNVPTNHNNGTNNGGNGTNGGGNGTQGGSPSNNPNNSSDPNNSNQSSNSGTVNHYYYNNSQTGNNNTINSSSDGAVISSGNNNTINANGAVIVSGDNNTVNARGIVIANGSNNTVHSDAKVVYNDSNTHDSNYQQALANGVVVNVSNMSNQTIND